MLLNDEKLILKWLSDYGPLPPAQVVSLLFDKSEDLALKIINGLIKRGYVANRKDGYLGVDYNEAPDDRNITALWVLTQYISEIHPNAHHPAEYPSQVYFLKGEFSYEIAVIKESESRNLMLLKVVKEMKYIIVAPGPGLVDTNYLPDCPCIIATVEYGAGETPEINFYGG